MNKKPSQKFTRRIFTFNVLIEQDEDGFYVADCPQLQGCYTQGKTLEEAIAHIKDVIRLCLEELRAERKSIPSEPVHDFIALKQVKVAL